MKERIVIKNEQAIDEWNRTIAQFIDVDNKIYKAEFIKVPESWEELKELCKGLENVSIHDVGGYIKLSINGNLIYFFIAGEMEGKIDITNNTFLERFCVIQKATPSQMWQIIKSLIGE